ncbi:MAG: 3'-5' exonuclease [Alphaproteobacteria bacterium]|nr:3'-5' exonuclease [Alphaproteobacteria bacterium]
MEWFLITVVVIWFYVYRSGKHEQLICQRQQLSELIQEYDLIQNLENGQSIPPEVELAKNEFIAIDLETTGLEKATSKILQIALVKFKGGKVCVVMNTYINPNIKIPKNATKVNHITNDMVRDQPDFSQLAYEIKRFIGNCPLVGHNLSYDIDILNSELERHNISHQLIWGYCTMLESPKREPVSARKKKNWRGNKYLKLSEAIEKYGIKPEGRLHDAYTDAKAAGDLFLAQSKIIQQKDIAYQSFCIERYYKRLCKANLAAEPYLNDAEIRKLVIRGMKIIESNKSGSALTALQKTSLDKLRGVLQIADVYLNVLSSKYRELPKIIISCKFCHKSCRLPKLEGGKKINVICPHCKSEQIFIY